MDAMRFRLLGRNVLLGEVPWSPLKAWQPRENGQASKQAVKQAQEQKPQQVGRSLNYRGQVRQGMRKVTDDDPLGQKPRERGKKRAWN